MLKQFLSFKALVGHGIETGLEEALTLFGEALWIGRMNTSSDVANDFLEVKSESSPGSFSTNHLNDQAA